MSALAASRFAIECDSGHAELYARWLAERGGIARWKSIDLGDPSAAWLTPARTEDGAPMPKPTWKAGNVPLIVTDPAQVGVYAETLYLKLTVSLKRSGLTLRLTDASQRKLERTMQRCHDRHGNAHYHKGGMFDPSIYVCYASESIALPEYLATQQEKKDDPHHPTPA